MCLFDYFLYQVVSEIFECKGKNCLHFCFFTLWQTARALKWSVHPSNMEDITWYTKGAQFMPLE